MRIVNRVGLMAMPAGTLYHEWEPCFFHGLGIKGETIPAHGTYRGDWYVTHVPQLDVHSSDEDCDVQFAMKEKGVAHPMDFEGYAREALYDDSLLYAVWEEADVRAFHSRLAKCLEAYVTAASSPPTPATTAAPSA